MTSRRIHLTSLGQNSTLIIEFYYLDIILKHQNITLSYKYTIHDLILIRVYFDIHPHLHKSTMSHTMSIYSIVCSNNISLISSELSLNQLVLSCRLNG